MSAGADRYRVIFDTMNAAILVIAVDGYTFVDANPRVCAMFGYTVAEMLELDVGRLSADVSPPALLDRAALRERARAGEPVIFPWHCRTKDGQLFWCEVAVRRTILDERDVFLLTAQNITQRIEARDALAYGDRLLNAATASIAELIVGTSLDAAVAKALAIMGAALHADRILVLEDVDMSLTLATNTSFLWQSSADLPALDASNVPNAEDARELRAWLAPLAAGNPVLTLARDATGFLARLMHDMKTLSVLLLPVTVDGTKWGHVAVEDCVAPRLWSKVEIGAFGIFAQVFGTILSRKKTHAATLRSAEQFRAVTETVQDAIVMIALDGRIAYWNRAAESIFGYTAAEAHGQLLHRWLAPPRFRAEAARGMAEFVTTGEGPILGKVVEIAATRKDGVEIAIELSVNPMTVGGERFAVGSARDITDRKRAAAQIERMARYDALTDLPNRRLFVQSLDQAIGRAHRSGQGFGVLYLDLDNFKDVNDTLGHPAGDRLLQVVAERLSATVREVDTVARFGGDEFAVIGIDIREAPDAAILADKIVRALAAPFTIDGKTVRTGASVGIAVYGPGSDSAESLLANADVALYRAKRDGRGRYRFYSESMDRDVRERAALDRELAGALAGGEFVVFYQPQIDIESGRFAGIEALVRWQHPQRGLVGPDSFIDASESSGAIVALGLFVTRKACAQMRAWVDAGIAPPVVGVNVSSTQFKASVELVSGISRVLSRTGVAAPKLELELTESVLMAASLRHADTLTLLRRMGVRVAIDDFGTGYSSLDYLRRFRVDRIKIPGTFVANICTDDNSASIVRATLFLARELDIEVVAEGVETVEQLLLLRSWGCRIVQGYYYSKPLTAHDATALLRIGRVDPDHPGALALAGAAVASRASP